jgi:hypothetical protein
VQRQIIRVRVIMTAANFSPAVASRRAKYVDELRVSMLLIEQPRSHNFFKKPTQKKSMALRD